MLRSTQHLAGSCRKASFKVECPWFVNRARSLATAHARVRCDAAAEPAPKLKRKVRKPKGVDNPINRPVLAPAGLNAEQKEAAETEHNVVRVKAGPGTGKTRVVIARAHHLIANEGVAPNRILIITFTNKAAREIVERLEAAGYGGSGTAAAGDEASSLAANPGVLAKTFHGLGVHILRDALKHVSEYGVNSRFKIMDAEESFRLCLRAIMEVEEASPLPASQDSPQAHSEPEPPSLPQLLPPQEPQPPARAGSAAKAAAKVAKIKAKKASKTESEPPPSSEAPKEPPPPSEAPEKFLERADIKTLADRLAYLIPDVKTTLAHLGHHTESQAVRVASGLNGVPSIPDKPAGFPFSNSGTSSEVKERWYKERVQAYYSAYQRLLRSNNALDFTDLICLPVRIFDQHPAVLRDWQGRFDHILVDEFQDVDPAQYRMVKLLKGASVGLFVVGDPDQAIYGWRGARSENMGANFEEDFASTETYGLSVNYRSVPEVLASADKLLCCEGAPELYVKQSAARPPAEHQVLSYHVYSNPEEEATHIVRKVAGWARRGELGSDPTQPLFNNVAVLYRNRILSRALEEKFTRAGLPYVVLGGLPFWQYKEIKTIRAYLHVVLGPYDSDVFLEQIINTPKRGIGDAAVAALQKAAKASDMTLGQLLFGDFSSSAAASAAAGAPSSSSQELFAPDISDDSPLKSVKLSKAASQGIKHLRTTVFVARSLAAKGGRVYDVLEAVLSLSGCEAELQKELPSDGGGAEARSRTSKRKSADEEARERRERLRTLQDLASSPDSWIAADDAVLVSERLTTDDAVSEQGPVRSASPPAAAVVPVSPAVPQPGAVRSKDRALGLEGLARFLEHAALVTGVDTDGKGERNAVRLMTIHASKGLEYERVFIVGLEEGILPSSRTSDPDEEKRLFYVALTRSKDMLFLSRCEKRTQFGVEKECQPSSFLFKLELKTHSGSD